MQRNSLQLNAPFDNLAQDLKMEYELRPREQKMILVSKIGHCLNDLLFRQKAGQLGIEVPLIVSNHPDFAFASYERDKGPSRRQNLGAGEGAPR